MEYQHGRNEEGHRTFHGRERGHNTPFQVVLEIDNHALPGELSLGPHDQGIVVFAHGSGSSRHSPRNRFVASKVQEGEFGTLLFDLLTPDEDAHPQNRFNIELLTTRLLGAIEWLRNDEVRQHLPVGIFGASTGAASMLRAAALSGGDISAVVSRGGRPDLAEGYLERVRCPTLFIVGGEDSAVLECNRAALARLGSSERHLEVIPGATHLFPEEGALERVAAVATEWFQRHLRAKR